MRPDSTFLVVPRVHRPPDLLTTGEWRAITIQLRLSPREAQMVRVSFYDESVVEIARRLGVSSHTVHTYRERVFRKLGVHSFCQVISIVFAAYLAARREAQMARDAERPAPVGCRVSLAEATPTAPT